MTTWAMKSNSYLEGLRHFSRFCEYEMKFIGGLSLWRDRRFVYHISNISGTTKRELVTYETVEEVDAFIRGWESQILKK